MREGAEQALPATEPADNNEEEHEDDEDEAEENEKDESVIHVEEEGEEEEEVKAPARSPVPLGEVREERGKEMSLLMKAEAEDR